MIRLHSCPDSVIVYPSGRLNLDASFDLRLVLAPSDRSYVGAA